MSIALVTGATRGIGRATAVRLARDGHTIAVGYGSNQAAAESLALELGGIAVGGDLRDPATSSRLVDDVEAALGPVEILIANAAINSPPRQVSEISLSEWDALIEVNLRAPFLLAQRVLPGMVERGFGRIVFLSSVAAYTGGIIGAHYAASKAGLHGLAHNIAKQVARSGVTANVVAPALIESDMLPDGPGVRERLAEQLPVGRLGQPEEVAELIAAVVANGFLTNQTMLLDGGWHPH